MNTKDLVGLLLHEELHLPLSVEVRLRTGVGEEREFAGSVFDARGLELLLGLANPCDLGVGVHNRRDRAVVDVAVAGVDVLRGGDTLLLCLVCEHGPKCHVTDAPNALDRGVELVVDNDTPLVVDLDADLVEVEPVGHWAPADSDEDDVGFELGYGMTSVRKPEGTGEGRDLPCLPFRPWPLRC